MAVFRRPELEKDNPIAPQMYVGPRRRRALLREASLSPASRRGNMAETLQALRRAFPESPLTLRVAALDLIMRRHAG